MTKTTTRPVTGVDTHAHIFRQDLPMVEGRRYSPGYDASVEDYLAHLDRHGLSHGILIQPSFLGTDNSYIERAIAAHPDRLRGVAVVERDVAGRELDRLVAAGFRGARLNLVGRALEDYAEPKWQRFFEALAERNLQLEIQRRFEDFPAFLSAMIASGVTIVIDHFGLPEGGVDPAKAQHAALLDLLASSQVWLKVSAIYRGPMTEEEAVQSLQHLRRAAGGIDRMIWGSDWPHTQHEREMSYDAAYGLTERLFPIEAERHRILVDNATALFELAKQSAEPDRASLSQGAAQPHCHTL